MKRYTAEVEVVQVEPDLRADDPHRYDFNVMDVSNVRYRVMVSYDNR